MLTDISKIIQSETRITFLLYLNNNYLFTNTPITIISFVRGRIILVT